MWPADRLQMSCEYISVKTKTSETVSSVYKLVHLIEKFSLTD